MNPRRILLTAVVALALATVTMPSPASASTATMAAPRAATGVAAAPDNPIVVENQQPGTSAWLHGPLVADDTAQQIKGYWSATSVKQGSSIDLFVTTNP